MHKQDKQKHEQTRTNKNKQTTKQVHNFNIKIGFRNLKKIVGYCLTSSCKVIQKRINGNIKVHGSHLKFGKIKDKIYKNRMNEYTRV